ncbi:MAG TPA: hypothetical protein VKT82_17050 [Ktedonobacterales bacterium]|nr:hypothetical protein [Ktedonobacterales bacterium]
MPDSKIADLFQIRGHFLRSIHLSRDFNDASALQSYVLTSHAKDCLQRMMTGLSPQSGQRAWRITGDYGSGKSSLALVLAHLLAPNSTDLPAALRQAIDFTQLGVAHTRLLPVLVTGSREALSLALLRALRDAVQNASTPSERVPVVSELDAALDAVSGEPPSDVTTLALLQQVSEHMVETGKASGLLIILDELGKFLEYAAQHPERQDIYLLQCLAEAAARSGRRPLLLVGLLHQGFHTYADQLSQASQREWEKVAGRFEEILFNQPLVEIAGLIGDALGVQVARVPEQERKDAVRAMEITHHLAWYGASTGIEQLCEQAPRIYPLHPTVLPVLIRLFTRFGQNERSLFSFLLSTEPFGLQEFAAGAHGQDDFYRLHHLYDYVRSTFGHRLAVQSYRSHWTQIDSVINSVHTDDPLELQLLKTVGLLNLLDAPHLLATDEALIAAVGGGAVTAGKRVKLILQQLQKKKHLLHFRGAAGGYCLWPYTSVNLERALEDAHRALGSYLRVSGELLAYLETRPLVARRHYIQTGTLRHFELIYVPVTELAEATKPDAKGAVGRIVVPLCETQEEQRVAIVFASSPAMAGRSDVLIAIPQPLSDLAGLMKEARYWQWVNDNTPELANDTFAAEEVSRMVAASRHMLEQRIQSCLGVQQSSSSMELQWYRQGEPLAVHDRRQLLALLSDICDQTFPLAPMLKNELVNRETLSSAAAAARTRLIEQVLSAPDQPWLGMDPTQKPPEMSIYLSILRRTGLHREMAAGWRLGLPSIDRDPYRVCPALVRIRQVLEENPNGRATAADIFDALREAPYGVPLGVSPLLLAVFAAINARDVAFYEHGSFLPSVSGHDFRRLLKNPTTFQVQFCEVTGKRTDLFNRLRDVLRVPSVNMQEARLLDVVRPLFAFAARLPEYTRKTQMLSNSALDVRKVLLSAREPGPLLFRDLPVACGFAPIPADGTNSGSDVQGFVAALSGALDELRNAYPNLIERMKGSLSTAFGLEETATLVREELGARVEHIIAHVTEPRLKSFCLRLSDTYLPEAEWVESLGSFVCSRVPTAWVDSDVRRFMQELNYLCARFQRVESIRFARSDEALSGEAVRVALTRSDGTEREQVVFLSPGEKVTVTNLASQMTALLKGHGRLGLVAATQALWQSLTESEEGEQ